MQMHLLPIYESGPNSHNTLQSQDETLLKDDTAIQQCWREHFEVHLNRTTVVTGDTIMSTPQHPERPSLDILPTLDDVQRVTVID